MRQRTLKLQAVAALVAVAAATGCAGNGHAATQRPDTRAVQKAVGDVQVVCLARRARVHGRRESIAGDVSTLIRNFQRAPDAKIGWSLPAKTMRAVLRGLVPVLHRCDRRAEERVRRVLSG
jgi:hypothetical protein